MQARQLTLTHQLNIAGKQIQIEADQTTSELLEQNYSQLLSAAESGSPADLCYKVRKQNDGFLLHAPSDELILSKTSEFIYYFEKDLTINLQKLRPDLFFMHGACLQLNEHSLIITGPSGSGKSTTTWALTHHGFRYLSDELSPVQLDDITVEPYPHALCLKKTPPEPYTLPESTLRTDYTMHIPVDYLNGGIQLKPARLTHLFLVKYNPSQTEVSLETFSTAQASMHIYSNALNPLCHEQDGLPAAAHIASAIQCFSLEFSDVYQACMKIREILQQHP